MEIVESLDFAPHVVLAVAAAAVVVVAHGHFEASRTMPLEIVDRT